MAIDYFCIGLSIGMIVCIFIEVFFRYVLRHPLIWPIEITQFLLVWVTFVAAGVGVKRAEELRMKALINRIPIRPRSFLEITIGLISIFFLAYLIKYGIDMIFYTAGQRSNVTEIPYSYPYAAIPVGAVLMSIYIFLKYIVKNIRGIVNPASFSNKP